MAELHPELAKAVARSAIDRAASIQCERNTPHGFALDTITELAAMVLNLADRVPAPDNRERTPPPCKNCGGSWWEGDPPKCMRCTAPAASSADGSGVPPIDGGQAK